MSKINELIEKLCPNGVEWKTLSEVCDEIIVPMRDRPKVFDGEIPWCRIEDKEGQFFNKSLSGLGVSEKVIKEMNLKVFPTGSVICSCSASIGAYAINTQPLITNQTFIGLVCGEKLFNRFLLYYMETQTKALLGLATTGTIPYISRQKFESLSIPLPPLEIQNRIVEILDHFTNLTANLTAELNLRRKQFEHYREKLFSLDGVEGVEWKKLGEVAEIGTGSRNTIDGKTEGLYPFYTRGQEVLRLDDYDFDETSIITAGDGAGVGKTFHFVVGKYALHQRAYRIVPQQNIVNANFLYYYMRNTFYDYIMQNSVFGSVPSVRRPKLMVYPVPVPPLAVQQSIVEKLDNFTALIENIEKELDLRQKQYEYYREQLLSFN